MKKAAVIGAGKFGAAVARRLVEGEVSVLLIDKSEELLDELKDVVDRAIVADATDMEAMRSSGLGEVETAVVTMGDHFEAAVLCVAVLRDLGVKRIVARANNVREEKILKMLGAHRIVFIESETGRRLAEEFISPALTEQLDLPNGYSVLLVNAPERMIGQTLKELDLGIWYNVVILGIKRGNGETVDVAVPGTRPQMDLIPQGSHKVQAGDVFFVVGNDKDLANMMSACKE